MWRHFSWYLLVGGFLIAAARLSGQSVLVITGLPAVITVALIVGLVKFTRFVQRSIPHPETMFNGRPMPGDQLAYRRYRVMAAADRLIYGTILTINALLALALIAASPLFSQRLWDLIGGAK